MAASAKTSRPAAPAAILLPIRQCPWGMRASCDLALGNKPQCDIDDGNDPHDRRHHGVLVNLGRQQLGSAEQCEQHRNQVDPHRAALPPAILLLKSSRTPTRLTFWMVFVGTVICGFL